MLPDGTVAALEPIWPVPPVFRLAGPHRRRRRRRDAARVQLRHRHGAGGRRRRRGDASCWRGKAKASTASAVIARRQRRGRAIRIDLPDGLAGMRRRVAILISGRGSNMAALIAAARDPGYPAEIVLVMSNRPDAARPGAGARTPAITARAIDHRPFSGDRAAHEAAIDAALRDAGHRDRLPRRLHAAADARSWSSLAGPHAEHPSQPAAGLSRACTRMRAPWRPA